MGVLPMRCPSTNSLQISMNWLSANVGRVSFASPEMQRRQLKGRERLAVSKHVARMQVAVARYQVVPELDRGCVRPDGLRSHARDVRPMSTASSESGERRVHTSEHG